MQEIGKLVLGIDLCDDITQVTIMRPHAAEPDAVCFDARARKEFLPTVLYVGRDGTWSVGEPVGKEDIVIANFFHKAVLGEEVSCNDAIYAGQALLELYIGLLLQKIKEHFPEYDMVFLAVTCEEANTNEEVRRLLGEVLAEQEAFCSRCLVLSHLEAFLHFAVRQEEGLWKNGSAAFDYAAEGLLFYHTECRSAGGRRLLLADYKDYSEIIPAGFTKSDETERVALTFERLAGMALQKNAASLFVTGREFEGDWVSDVLRLLSSGRRVFRGENLYTQGACYAAAEEFRGEKNADFALLMPGQITCDVYLMAENAEQEEEVLLARVGDHYRQVQAEIEVLMDTTDKFSFKIVPAGGGKSFMIRVAPRDLELRPDRTSRYAVRVSFVKRDCMAIQIKDVGFGEFYPSGHRIYEELVELSQLEG
ncbi:MAG: hypothetical protein IJW37_02530 [Lachnospiraceae bacterium]|nr:hypothetical protein [Lachnospiraceae bacterium]